MKKMFCVICLIAFAAMAQETPVPQGPKEPTPQEKALGREVNELKRLSREQKKHLANLEKLAAEAKTAKRKHDEEEVRRIEEQRKLAQDEAAASEIRAKVLMLAAWMLGLAFSIILLALGFKKRGGRHEDPEICTTTTIVGEGDPIEPEADELRLLAEQRGTAHVPFVLRLDKRNGTTQDFSCVAIVTKEEIRVLFADHPKDPPTLWKKRKIKAANYAGLRGIQLTA